MKRYLLFDSGCGRCSKIAQSIEREAGGKLTIRSLRDPEVKALLDRERPGWKWEPMLVEEKQNKVQVYAGGAMARRLLMALGPRRAFRIMGLTTSSSLSEVDSSQSNQRRHFLKLAGTAVVGAAALMIPRIGYADGGSAPNNTRVRLEGDNPFARLRIAEKTKLEGNEAKIALERAFTSKDIQAISKRYPGELKPITIEKASLLEEKNTGVLFIAFEVIESQYKGVVLYVLLDRPVGWLNSYALFFDGERDLSEEKTLFADMTVVNGRKVMDIEAVQSRIAKENPTIGALSSDPCGGCYNPFYFYCYAPIGIDVNCALRTAPWCGSCRGSWICWVGCVGMSISNCLIYGWTCCSCFGG